MAMGEEASVSTAASSTIEVIINDDSGASKYSTTTTNHNNHINSSSNQPIISSGDTRSSSSASFLVRLHPGYFTITLSMSSQALLWKMLSQQIGCKNETHAFFASGRNCLPLIAFHLLWWLAFSYLLVLTFLYFLRCIFHLHILKNEFSNHVGLNYLFAPWVSWLLLLQSLPFTVSRRALWWPLAIPVIFLDLKLYGQWFTTEKRFLSMAANPTSQMSVVANMVAAWTASQMGWKESAVCIFAVGAVHYFVVFVTLYQRLSASASNFPAILRPLFLLFVAAPSAASLAWCSILGTFTVSCKLLFFLSLFLFMSLACRPALFKKSLKRYNVGWWAYSFPLTLLALASSEYGRHFEGVVVADGLTLFLSAFSVVVFSGLMIATALNAQTLVRESDPFLTVTSDFPRT